MADDEMPEPPSKKARNSDKFRDWALWEAIGSPRFVAAPMVDQSELAFRMLCRRYGTQLAYTPMFHGRLFAENAKYRTQQFSTCPEDRPLFAQFCGDDPATLVAAAKHVENEVDAVDLNLGCPQGIARKGHDGSFLLTEGDLLESIVRRMDAELRVPVTVKMRLVTDREDLQDTLSLASRLEAAGASVVTLHGRTKEMKGPKVGECNWQAIAAVKQRLRVPVIANGGVECYEDAVRCLEVTGCDAVMSSEALLETPSLFAGPGRPRLQEDLALEYLEAVRTYGPTQKAVKSHLFHFLYSGLQPHTDLRTSLGQAKGIDELSAVTAALKKRRAEDRAASRIWPESGWYLRYRRPLGERKREKEGEGAPRVEAEEAQAATEAVKPASGAELDALAEEVGACRGG